MDQMTPSTIKNSKFALFNLQKSRKWNKNCRKQNISIWYSGHLVSFWCSL